MCSVHVEGIPQHKIHWHWKTLTKKEAICCEKAIWSFSRNLSKSIQRRVKQNDASFLRKVKLVRHLSMKITPLRDNQSNASGVYPHTHTHVSTQSYFHIPLACSDVSTKQLWVSMKGRNKRERKMFRGVTSNTLIFHFCQCVHQSYSNLTVLLTEKLWQFTINAV